MVIGVSQ